MSKPAAFVLGYTGATGKALVQVLAKDDYFGRIVLIGRREVQLDVENDARFEQKIVDFDNIEKHEEVFRECNTGFCLLGTTVAVSGRAGFVKVDRDYVINTAKVAKATGCKHFLLVSSVGADKNSMLLIFKTKGQAEEGVRQIGFDRLSILRPGALQAKRTETRFGEQVFLHLIKPVKLLFPTRLAIPVEKVAAGLVNHAKAAPSDLSSPSSVEEFDNRAIYKLADHTEKRKEK